MRPKVSVIMPSLNVGEYIERCLDSVVNQSLNEIEIISVDAMSTDGTTKIIERYAAIDNRIKIIKTEKKSYGIQMNLGLDGATGEYIAFLETDDFMTTYALEKMYFIAKEDNLEYIKGWTYSFFEEADGLRRVWDDDRISRTLPFGEGFFSPQEYPELLTMDFHVWNGIYKQSFLKNVRFNETRGAAFQDIGFIVQCLTKAKRARYVDLPVYWYRRSNAASSVYNVSGLMYLADEYERIVRIGEYINTEQWKYIWKRLLMQILTRLETMYKGVKAWPSYETDMQRLCALLKGAARSDGLEVIDENDVYGKLLKLMLAGEFGTLNNSGWLIAPVRCFIDVFEKDKVLIYGAGKRGRMLMEAALRMGKWPPLAFVDSNPQMWEKIVSGIRVISLDEAMEKYPWALYLVAVKGNEQEIKENLLVAGVDEGHILCFDVEGGAWHRYMAMMSREVMR